MSADVISVAAVYVKSDVPPPGPPDPPPSGGCPMELGALPLGGSPIELDATLLPEAELAPEALLVAEQPAHTVAASTAAITMLATWLFFMNDHPSFSIGLSLLDIVYGKAKTLREAEDTCLWRRIADYNVSLCDATVDYDTSMYTGDIIAVDSVNGRSYITAYHSLEDFEADVVTQREKAMTLSWR